MHLWQIRHIPNRRQTLLRLTTTLCLLPVVAASLFLTRTSTIAVAADEDAGKGTSEKRPTPAAEFLERVRQELLGHQSIKANMTQLVSLGDQRFKVDGTYLSAGNKLKLSYSVSPDQGVRGEMLEVCDGKELWTMITLPDVPDSKRVTRRNIKQILEAAVAADQRKISEASISVELGLGGLTALFASLSRTMEFDGMKEEVVEGRATTIIQGRWKKDKLPQAQKDSDAPLPPFIPDLVRVYVDSKTLFPEKILYLKKQPQKKAYRSLVSLEFHDVEFDGPVDDNTFVFLIPRDVVPEDVTKQYLDSLATPKSNTPATKN